MLTILVFIFVLGVLVLAHEFGHFIMAKRNGVRAEEFGFGFPPRLFGLYRNRENKWRMVWGNKKVNRAEKRRDETVFSLNLLPFGGFVKITGENGEEEAAETKGNELSDTETIEKSTAEFDPQSFANQSLWVRFKILVAGVVMNFLLAIVLFTLSFWLGAVPTLSDTTAGETTVLVTMVAENSPAEQAGLKSGDQILAVIIDDRKKEINSVQELQNLINQHRDRPIKLVVKHLNSKTEREVTVRPRLNPPPGEGAIGVGLSPVTITQHNLFSAFQLALKTTWNLTGEIFKFLGRLIISPWTKENLLTEVAGPIGIAKMSGQAAQFGLPTLLQFMALLSVNLAVINLLPFPGLDGGRILFLLIEKIKGRPLPARWEQLINTVGFFFLLLLMVLVIIKDLKLF